MNFYLPSRFFTSNLGVEESAPTFHFLVRWRLIFRRKRLVTERDYRGLKREQSPHLSLLQLSHSLRQSAAATLLPLAAAAAAAARAATLTHTLLASRSSKTACRFIHSSASSSRRPTPFFCRDSTPGWREGRGGARGGAGSREREGAGESY